jgi:hypothetical protein
MGIDRLPGPPVQWLFRQFSCFCFVFGGGGLGGHSGLPGHFGHWGHLKISDDLLRRVALHAQRSDQLQGQVKYGTIE